MIIRLSALFVALSISLWLQGCCQSQHIEPSYPNEVTGWKDFKNGSTKLRGSFVLKKAERTDNGKLEIRVLDLMPTECTGDAGNYAERARVRLEFRRVSDQRLLCSETFPENGGGSVGISEEFGVFGVSVRAINLKDGWVFFILDGDY